MCGGNNHSCTGHALCRVCGRRGESSLVIRNSTKSADNYQERGAHAGTERLREQQVEGDRAESGQTRQGKQCLFLAFRPRFRSFLGFMQHIGMFVLQSQATGPSVLCASQPKTFGTRRRGRLSSYTPSCLHALVFPDDYSELAISYSRHVKPAVHIHSAIPLAVNMLFCLLYSAPRQDRGKCQAKRSRH